MAELTEDERLFLKRKKLMEELIATDGWKEFERILRAQYEAHLQSLLPAASPEYDGLAQVMTSEYRKGAVFAIGIALKTPHGIIAEAKNISQAHQTVKEDSNAPRSQRTEQQPSLFDDSGDELPEHARVTDLGGDD